MKNQVSVMVMIVALVGILSVFAIQAGKAMRETSPTQIVAPADSTTAIRFLDFIAEPTESEVRRAYHKGLMAGILLAADVIGEDRSANERNAVFHQIYRENLPESLIDSTPL